MRFRPPLTAVQYVICPSGFADDVMFTDNGANGPKNCIYVLAMTIMMTLMMMTVLVR